MSGGGGEQTTEVRINPLMRQGGRELQQAGSDLFNQGTSGIYQGSRLAEFNPYIQQGEQQLLDQWSPGGQLQNMTNTAMNSYQQLLGAGDYDNPFLREQIANIVDNAGSDFRRSVAPRLDQASTGAGQYGSSRAGIAEGVALSDMEGHIANASIDALLGGQQLALQANQLLPQMQGAGSAGANAMMNVGQARTARDQAQLLDEIQMFEAPRNAELQRQQQYASLMGMNPLMGEQTQITSMPESDPWAQGLGLAATVAGGMFGGPMGASMGSMLAGGLTGGGGGLGSLFGGGGGSSVPGTGGMSFGEVGNMWGNPDPYGLGAIGEYL